MGVFKKFSELKGDELIPWSMLGLPSRNLNKGALNWRNRYPVQTKKQYLTGNKTGKSFLLGMNLLILGLQILVISGLAAIIVALALNPIDGGIFIQLFLGLILVLISYGTYRFLPLIVFYVRNF
jgi:hypothetical protein